MQKTTKKKIAPIAVTVLIIAYIAPMLVMVLRAMGILNHEEGVKVMFSMLCWLVVGGAVIVGVLRALGQRLKEIDGGEEEDASKY